MMEMETPTPEINMHISESMIYHVGPSWKGFSSIRRLFIFGDSYSCVEFINDNERPTAIQPLGVEFPGFTFNEPGLPNWVGHLITKHCPEPRYNPNAGAEQDKAWVESPLLAHTYAKGGDTVKGVQRQIESLFLPVHGKKSDWAPWTAEDTLFIIWVGINDCASPSDPTNAIKNIFSAQGKLFDAGARNFLLFDVPTVHRSPAGKYTSCPWSHVLGIVETWNKKLREETERFRSEHKDATVLLFSAFKAFDTLLDNADRMGFNSKDLRRQGGSIWVDHLHPTSKVHDYIAQNVAEFLFDVSPSLL